MAQPPSTHPQLDENADVWLQYEGIDFCHRVRPHESPQFEPVLFVSGAFQNMDSWSRFANVFAKLTTVVLMDPPGMGKSDVLSPEFGSDFLAGCIERVLDELSIERINIIAASYGTPAAYRFAQLRPHRVSRIVLAGTAKELAPHMLERVAATVDIALSGDRELLAERVVGEPGREGLLCRDRSLPVRKRELAERVLRANILGMSDVELRQYAANTRRLLDHEALTLAPVDGPVALVLTGEHDCFTTPAQSLEVAETFGTAWFTVIQEADHVFHLERFDVAIGLFVQFMRGTLGSNLPGCAPIRSVGNDQILLEA
jgi:pimeloyl-ACP methyl ester carboxylesterase